MKTLNSCLEMVKKARSSIEVFWRFCLVSGGDGGESKKMRGGSVGGEEGEEEVELW